MNIPYKRCSTKKHLYQLKGREFRGGSDEKLLWFAFLPSSGRAQAGPEMP